MSLQPLTIPPGLQSDDTTLAAAPAWADGSNVRFRFGLPQVVGGWESVTPNLLSGVCRTVFAWTDNSNTPLLGFGTNTKLEVWANDATLYDVTPFGPISLLGSAPFATTNGSAVVTVTHTAHGLASTNQVIISGAVDTNGILAANLNGTRTITVTTANAYTFTAGSNATSTATGGGSAVRIVPQVVLPAAPSTGRARRATGPGPTAAGATAPHPPTPTIPGRGASRRGARSSLRSLVGAGSTSGRTIPPSRLSPSPTARRPSTPCWSRLSSRSWRWAAPRRTASTAPRPSAIARCGTKRPGPRTPVPPPPLGSIRCRAGASSWAGGSSARTSWHLVEP
jgi:hypothetical protein